MKSAQPIYWAVLALCQLAPCAASLAGEFPVVSVEVAADAAVAAARTKLMEHLQQIRPDLTRIDLAPITKISATSSNDGAVDVVATAIHNRTLAPRACVWVQIRSGEHSTRTVPIWFSVRAWRPVLVSRSRHAARDSISAVDFKLEERDVASLTEIPVSAATDLMRQRTRRAFSRDHVLLEGDVEPVPQVLRGSDVVVQVEAGAVRIETKAIAMRDARLGEAVTVKNPTSQETYIAQVIGPSRARVTAP